MPGYAFRARKLVRNMPHRAPRYIQRNPRDFFYLTLRPVLPGPALSSGEALSTAGLLGYLTPVLQFLIGWQLYGEPMNPMRMLSFGLIWTALVIFIVEGVRAGRAAMQARRDEAAAPR